MRYNNVFCEFNPRFGSIRWALVHKTHVRVLLKLLLKLVRPPTSSILFCDVHSIKWTWNWYISIFSRVDSIKIHAWCCMDRTSRFEMAFTGRIKCERACVCASILCLYVLVESHHQSPYEFAHLLKSSKNDVRPYSNLVRWYVEICMAFR